MRLSRVLFAAFLLAIAGLVPAFGQEAATISLRQGDAVRLKVFGQPELSDIYVIEAGGRLIIPGLGELLGAATLDDVRAGVGDLVDRNLGLGGTSFSVTIAALRPITVGGSVADPGEVPYSLGIRVAQAIARAGGRSQRLGDDFGRILQVNQEKERYAQAEMRLARALLTEARLRAELDGVAFDSVPEQVVTLVGQDTADRLLSSELGIAETQAANMEIARTRINAAIEINGDDISAQESVTKSLQTQLDLVRADLERLNPLIESGSITGSRILALRRDIADVEGLVGQASGALAKSSTERVVLSQEKKALVVQRRLDLLSLMIEIQVEIVNARTSIAAIGETLDAADAAPLQGGAAARPGDCSLTIMRERPSGEPDLLQASLLTRLEPGDHLEVGRTTRDCPDLLSGGETTQ